MDFGKFPLAVQGVIAFGFFGCLSLVVWSMWPALPGPFVFDDFHNLSKLGEHGGVYSYVQFKQFVFGGEAGPTGRPLSLLSFLINDNTWPGYSFDWRYTNMCVHILNSVLVFVFLRMLLPMLLSHVTASRRDTLALLGMAVWALHPLQQSAVFLIVQRMTLLSMLFSLLALIAYLRAKRCSTASGVWLWLCLSGISWLAGVFSKETAAVTLLVITALEFFYLPRGMVPERVARVAFLLWRLGLVLYSFAFLAVLIYYAEDSSVRDFTNYERLLTEGRVLAEYWRVLILPSASSLGVYHDDFIISRGWLDPVATLSAWAMHAFVLVVAVFLRKRYTLISLGLVWFYLGHALESTSINLELYFDHRNYFPSIGYALILIGLVNLVRQRIVLCGSAIAVYLMLLLLVDYSHSIVWHNEARLFYTWKMDKPNSLRAQREWGNFLLRRGQFAEAQLVFTGLQERYPEYLTLAIDRTLIACNLAQPAPFSGAQLGAWAPASKMDNILDDSIQNLVSLLLQERCEGLTLREVDHVIAQLLTNPRLTYPRARALLFLERARIAIEQRNLDRVIQWLESAWEADQDAYFTYLQAYFLATAGLYDDALGALERGEKQALPATLAERRFEIDALRTRILDVRSQSLEFDLINTSPENGPEAGKD